MKVGAIARYELLMAWRRRSFVILLLVLVLFSLALSLLAASQANARGIVFVDSAMRDSAAGSGWSVEALMLTQQEISHTALIVLVFNIALVLIVAETIPLDRQFNIRELLDALPVSRTAYLGGKLLGTWGGMALILLIGGTVSIITQRLILGEFNLRALALFWLAVALPLCLANSSISVLAAAFWRSRRAAVMFNLLLLPLCLLLLWGALMHLSYVSGLIDPVYLRTVASLPVDGSLMAEIALHIAFGLALLAAVVALVWIAVWALMRFLEAR